MQTFLSCVGVNNLPISAISISGICKVLKLIEDICLGEKISSKMENFTDEQIAQVGYTLHHISMAV